MRPVYAYAGPFGPMAVIPGNYTRPANPWVVARPQFSIGATQSPQPLTMTLAGQKDSCCSGCAAAHRKGQ